MPIDNREERQSAISFLMRWMPPGVDPSAIDQAERQSAAYAYPGIPAALGGNPVLIGGFSAPSAENRPSLIRTVARPLVTIAKNK